MEETELIGVVYLARNMLNNDVYIGYSMEFKKRKRAHLTAAENGDGFYFHRAIRKYGHWNFSWSFIKYGPESELKRLEISAIAQYKAAGYKVYNLTDGGEGGLSPSSETLAKRSNSLKARWKGYTPEKREWRANITRTALNRPEVRAKISAATKEALARPEVKDKLKKMRNLS